MPKKVLIVFPDYWLPYSPTVLNLYDVLNKEYDVTIVAPAPEYFTTEKLDTRATIYVTVPKWLEYIARQIHYYHFRLSQLTGLFKAPQYDWRRLLRALILWANLFRAHIQIVIGVDAMGLWAAQKRYGAAHFLSLEINNQDPYFQRIDRGKIQSVIIQSEERYKYLFGDRKLRTFLVQNAPIYKAIAAPARDPKALVYSGTMVPQFGIYDCLEFISRYPEFTLTFRGGMPRDVLGRVLEDYSHLVEAKRLLLDETYIDQADIVEYLSRFYVGFCLYDTKALVANSFNYESMPSGKLFMYYAAGVPVIASDIPGLKSVSDFNTGVLMRDHSPDSIRAAYERISQEYDTLSANCLKAAQHFSFDKSIEPFLDYLRKS